VSAIAGAFYRDDQAINLEKISAMMASLKHRGGDYSGLWHGASVSLGQHTRWITPESLYEKLPFTHDASQVTIVADARLDNRDELISKLCLSSSDHSRIGDGELILLSYLKWERNCLDHLLGDFVFALWDDRNHQLVLAKDHIGFSNLYYYVDSNLFAFASEIKSLFNLKEISRKLNRSEFLRCYQSHIIGAPSEFTFFENIKSLQGARCCVVTEKSFQITQYWQVEKTSPLKLKHEDEYLALFKSLFQDAVTCRMRTQFPVGSLLSGGLDSSSVVAVAANHPGRAHKLLEVFSHVLPENDSDQYQDERKYIELMRKSFPINVNYVDTTQCDAFKDLDRLFLKLEYPLITSRYYVYESLIKSALQKEIRVMLDGVGGEFTATSYAVGAHADLARYGKWITLIRLLRAQAKVENVSVRRLAHYYIIKPLIPRIFYQYYLTKKYGMNYLLTHSLLRSEHIYAMRNQPGKIEKALEPSFSRFSTSFKSKYTSDLELVQNCAMGLEEQFPIKFSFPFLDKRLIEFMYALPSDLRIKNGWSRYIARAGLNGVLPQEISWRKDKQAFSPAHESILRKSDASAMTILKQARQRSSVSAILDIDKISANWTKFASNEENAKFSYQLDPFYGVAAAQFLLSFENTL